MSDTANDDRHTPPLSRRRPAAATNCDHRSQDDCISIAAGLTDSAAWRLPLQALTLCLLLLTVFTAN
jgi:hypothetical protein